MIGKTNTIASIGDDKTLLSLINRSITSITIPKGTNIGDYAFYNCIDLEEINYDDSTRLGHHCFENSGIKKFRYVDGNTYKNCNCAIKGCSKIEEITFAPNVKTIGEYHLGECKSKIPLHIPEGVTYIYANGCRGSYFTEVSIPSTITLYVNGYAFSGCTYLTKLNIGAITNDKNSAAVFGGSSVFTGCTNLEDVTIADGFDAKGLNLSCSTKYTAETIVSWLEALSDRTGKDAYRLTIGATNLAKLTEEQIAIATAKNWTLA